MCVRCGRISRVHLSRACMQDMFVRLALQHGVSGCVRGAQTVAQAFALPWPRALVLYVFVPALALLRQGWGKADEA